ncbi:hypothetical protein VIGAN_11192500 [Vigna angularis var. angularis]|uniref:Uncharacterized protein n=1 Tax=Vigna angularis var. angularis TaxID=157739 RepID=A0A0S3TBR0_PHAAN|nr:hypothetical protein VIGAN_11192500 [Vigna angularis var. angularis]
MCNYTVKIWHETKKNQFLAISIILAINFSIWVHFGFFALLPGIPGLDESYLPRWIGYGFGSLLLLNHFLGSDAAAVTPAQLVREIKAENCIFVLHFSVFDWSSLFNFLGCGSKLLFSFVMQSTEVLGLSLASFSIVLPYLGKFLKGAQPVDEKTIPEGTEQIFVMSTEVGNGLKEDLAWASYVLLRNTNAIAMLILIQGEICARGYWNIPDDTSKEILPDWFKKKIEKAGLYDLKDTLYFPQDADSEFQDLVPMGTRCLLIQPVLHVSNENDVGLQKPGGFILLASTTRYAFSNKDKAWIAAVANKFRGRVV